MFKALKQTTAWRAKGQLTLLCRGCMGILLHIMLINFIISWWPCHINVVMEVTVSYWHANSPCLWQLVARLQWGRQFHWCSFLVPPTVPRMSGHQHQLTANTFPLPPALAASVQQCYGPMHHKPVWTTSLERSSTTRWGTCWRSLRCPQMPESPQQTLFQ